MRVKYIKNYNESENHSLTIDKEYIVLEISFINKSVKLRLICDTGTPAIFDLNLFQVTSSKIPSNWVIKFEEEYIKLSPEKWINNDLWQYSFWESYFDDGEEELKAIKVFEEEKKIIYMEEYPNIDIVEEHIKKLSLLVLKESMDGYNLKKGSIGKVSEIYEDGNEKFYDVEFYDSIQQINVSLLLSRNQFELMPNS